MRETPVDPPAAAGPSRGGGGPLWRRWLPLVGTCALVAYLVATTDLRAVAAAFAAADAAAVIAICVFGTLVTWGIDAACLALTLRWTLRDAPGPALTLAAAARLKGASYLLNAVNYNAATLGMAWVVARRRQVGLLQATVALGVLSWLDLVALALIVTVGLQLAPTMLASHAAMQARLQTLSLWILLASLAIVVLLPARLPLPGWRQLQAWPPLQPLRRLAPWATLLLVAARGGFILVYVWINYLMMQAFHMEPSFEALLVLVPILIVVGVVPVSVSGIGTTQVVARALYQGFVPAGVAAAPLIDAYTTTLIVGFVAARLLVALPFLRGMWAELRQQPTATAAPGG